VSGQADPLLDAVDRLTRPRSSWVLQANEAGIQCRSEVKHDPLLQQLREAVVGGIGSHAGSSAGHERLPFDAGALKLYSEIEDALTVMFVELVQEPVYLELERTARQWYLAYSNKVRAGQVPDSDVADTLNQLERWAHQIEGKFDPPQKLELTVAVRETVMKPKTRRRVDKETGESWRETVLDDHGQPIMVPKVDRNNKPIVRIVRRQPATCPRCGENFAFDPSTGDKILALVVEYREEGQSTIEHGSGFCRSCEHIWKAGTGMRELAWAIEQEEKALNAPEGQPS